MKRDTAICRGSTNVFADIGMPEPDIHLIKAELVAHVQDNIRRRRIGSPKAARMMDMDVTEFSEMLKGRFGDISIERIVQMLTKLGCDVSISVIPRSQTQGRPIIGSGR